MWRRRAHTACPNTFQDRIRRRFSLRTRSFSAFRGQFRAGRGLCGPVRGKKRGGGRALVSVPPGTDRLRTRACARIRSGPGRPGSADPPGGGIFVPAAPVPAVAADGTSAGERSSGPAQRQNFCPQGDAHTGPPERPGGETSFFSRLPSAGSSGFRICRRDPGSSAVLWLRTLSAWTAPSASASAADRPYEEPGAASNRRLPEDPEGPPPVRRRAQARSGGPAPGRGFTVLPQHALPERGSPWKGRMPGGIGRREHICKNSSFTGLHCRLARDRIRTTM